MSLTRALGLIVLATALSSTGVAAEVPGPDVAWVQPAEYPAEAVARRSEGNSTVEISYDENAVVTKCTLLRSSGDPILDEASCRLAMGSRIGNAQRPGAPVSRLTLMWKIRSVPQTAQYGGATPIGPNWWLQGEDYGRVPAVVRGARGSVVVRYTVSAEGRAQDCAGESSGGAELASQTCQLLERRAAFITPHDATGPKSTTASQTLIWRP